MKTIVALQALVTAASLEAEPTSAELDAIEREMPVITAELELLDAQITVLDLNAVAAGRAPDPPGSPAGARGSPRADQPGRAGFARGGLMATTFTAQMSRRAATGRWRLYVALLDGQSQWPEQDLGLRVGGADCSAAFTGSGRARLRAHGRG